MAKCFVRVHPPREQDGTYLVNSDMADYLEEEGLIRFDPVWGEYVDPNGQAMAIVLEAERQENSQQLH